MAKHQVVVPCETALQISCPHFSVFHRDTIIVDPMLHLAADALDVDKLLYSSLIDTLLYSSLYIVITLIKL